MTTRTTDAQTALTNQSVNDDMENLRSTLVQAAEGGPGMPQLAAMQSQTRILKRHLNRLFDLEEVDDYFQFAVTKLPHLHAQVAQLKAEHDEFRELINGLLARLDELENHDQRRFDAICLEIHGVVCRILAHGRAEGKLLSRALDCDEGGEG